MNGKDEWTADDEILVLWLYAYLRKMRIAVRPDNRYIAALAQIIGVSSASIVMKLGNIASLDEYNPAQGLSGGAALTRAVFSEYFADIAKLTQTAAAIRGFL